MITKEEAKERLKKEIITRTQNGEKLMPLMFIGNDLMGIPPYECLTAGNIISVFNELERSGLLGCKEPVRVLRNKHYARY